MNTFKIGQYVTYKNAVHMVVATAGNTGAWVRLINPAVGQGKVQVNGANCSHTNYAPARVIGHKGAEYLVTGKGLIISLTTNRVMNWGDENGNRIAILSK